MGRGDDDDKPVTHHGAVVEVGGDVAGFGEPQLRAATTDQGDGIGAVVNCEADIGPRQAIS